MSSPPTHFIRREFGQAVSEPFTLSAFAASGDGKSHRRITCLLGKGRPHAGFEPASPSLVSAAIAFISWHPSGCAKALSPPSACFFSSLNVPNSGSFTQTETFSKAQKTFGFSRARSLLSLSVTWLQRGRNALGRVSPRCLVCNVTTQPGVWLLLVFLAVVGFSLLLFLIDEFNFAGILQRFANQMLLLQDGAGQAGSSSSRRTGVAAAARSKTRGQGLPGGGCGSLLLGTWGHSCHENRWWHGGEPHRRCSHLPIHLPFPPPGRTGLLEGNQGKLC